MVTESVIKNFPVFLCPLKRKDYISYKENLLKYATALVMCSCLLFLTGINFFVYNQAENQASIQLCESSSSEGESSNGEESSGCNTNSVIQEEYVHEFHVAHQQLSINNATTYALLSEEKNYMVHYELIAPPPDL